MHARVKIRGDGKIWDLGEGVSVMTRVGDSEGMLASLYLGDSRCHSESGERVFQAGIR